jgi:hypothetical protein
MHPSSIEEQRRTDNSKRHREQRAFRREQRGYAGYDLASIGFLLALLAVIGTVLMGLQLQNHLYRRLCIGQPMVALGLLGQNRHWAGSHLGVFLDARKFIF